MGAFLLDINRFPSLILTKEQIFSVNLKKELGEMELENRHTQKNSFVTLYFYATPNVNVRVGFLLTDW